MNILGIRCSTKDFNFSVINGKQDNPNLIDSGTTKFPTGHNDAEKLNWFYQEIGGLIKKHSIGGIGIKGAEPLAMKGKNYGASESSPENSYIEK